MDVIMVINLKEYAKEKIRSYSAGDQKSPHVRKKIMKLQQILLNWEQTKNLKLVRYLNEKVY
jgi:hypothetical protein